MGFSHTTELRAFASEKLKKVGLFETEQMFCDIYCLEPGQAQAVHSHAAATKFYFVIDGQAAVTVGSETRVIGPGELAWSVPGEDHGVANSSEERLVLLVAMAPNPNSAP
ncbi:MAG: cupin domain-containing protein [Planctomycetota bacterium]|jgi:quercetin dioxygenase-like cupin family protein|nr:cupin [Planctomycetota bacterium]MDP6369149.1 cupin domain-containing protein [Planctomycetota bacterium]MDP6519273.1 cupin domain-containing protein [Planctomycetota bacterium]MDP6839703.1 cupin domain-containing protein [Planctomycetota bacterium]MDP6954645.1 cupin domain-containing protein [Planctomycetota bacterium]